MKYEDTRKGERVERPKKDDGVFVYGFAECSALECEVDDPSIDYSCLEEFSSPQFRGVSKDFGTARILQVTVEIEAEVKEYWADDDSDWSTLEWEFYGWERPKHGRTNLIGILYLEGHTFGMLVAQHVRLDGRTPPQIVVP